MLVCMLHLLNSELGLLSTLPPVNTVSAECFACGTLCARGILPTSAKDIVAQSKSITASVFYKKNRCPADQLPLWAMNTLGTSEYIRVHLVKKKLTVILLYQGDLLLLHAVSARWL